MSGVGLVILAAGASTRMGVPKQLLPYQGRSLIRLVAETAIASVCHPIMVVLGAHTAQIQPELAFLPLQVVENPCWSEGMSTSIQVGIETLKTQSPNAEAVVLMVCDQPFVSAQLINQLVEHYHTGRWRIVASEYSGVMGVPALFHHTLFPALMQLSGDKGARQIIQQAETVLGVPYPRATFDLDTPADYDNLLLQNSP